MSNTDLHLSNKVHKMANGLYNKGLDQAQGRCLSGAITTLSMCVSIQKHHTDARNLLGLIYWEVGEVGQAIKQWVISMSYKKEENLAVKYLEIIQSQSNQLARYNDTIETYNKALQYMQRGSEDIALISLRKAISQNPNYLEARALLSLYYITANQNDKAKEQLRAILLINKDHPKASRYWAQLKGDDTQEDQSAENIKPQQPKIRTFQPPAAKAADHMIEPKSIRGSIMAFTIGALCMLAVYGILISPSKTSDLKQQIKIAEENEASAKNQLETIQKQQESLISSLESDKAELENINKTLEKEQEIKKQTFILQDARNLSQNNEWAQSADKLYGMNQEILSEDARNQYNALIEAVYPKAGEQLYKEGTNHYQRREYPEAQQLLEKSYRYAKEEYYSSNVVYTLGRAYEDDENIEKAKQYYQLAIDEYGGSNGAANASWRLGQLE